MFVFVFVSGRFHVPSGSDRPSVEGELETGLAHPAFIGGTKVFQAQTPQYVLHLAAGQPPALPHPPPAFLFKKSLKPIAPGGDGGLGALSCPSNLKFPPEGNYQKWRRKPCPAVARTRRP